MLRIDSFLPDVRERLEGSVTRMMTARQNGGLVIVRDSDGRRVANHNAVNLAKEKIRLGDSAFVLKYGFRWDPTRTTLLEAQRQIAAR